MLDVMSPSHPMMAEELDNLWIDHDIDPDIGIEDPMKLLASAPCINHAATWVLRNERDLYPSPPASCRTIMSFYFCDLHVSPIPCLTFRPAVGIRAQVPNPRPALAGWLLSECLID